MAALTDVRRLRLHLRAKPARNLQRAARCALRSRDIDRSLPRGCVAEANPILSRRLTRVQNTQRRVNQVIGTSIGGAAVIYVVIGLLGCASRSAIIAADRVDATFGNRVGSNILDSYPGGLLITTCRIGIAVLVLFSYPLQVHPCRASLLKIFTSDEASEQPGSRLHTVLTVGILVTTYAVAMAVQQLDLVLGYVGATGSTTISFTLPAVRTAPSAGLTEQLFYLRLFRDDQSRHARSTRVLAWAILAWGLVR